MLLLHHKRNLLFQMTNVTSPNAIARIVSDAAGEPLFSPVEIIRYDDERFCVFVIPDDLMSNNLIAGRFS